MRTSSHAPFYDLFKLIVAILLTIVFLILIWNGNRPSPIPVPATETSPNPTLATASETSSPFISTETASPASVSSTQSPTASAAAQTPEIATPTITASPTLPPVAETLPTPIIEIPSDPDVCAAFSRARLQVGTRATILRRLNFRSSPGIRNNWILTNIPGTQVEVIGGPECTRYQNGGAYLWWQIRLPNGMEGGRRRPPRLERSILWNQQGNSVSVW